MTAADFSIPFVVPLIAIAAAFCIKLPGFVRHRHDRDVQAVAGLLLLALAVFVFAAPATLARVNRFTGIPNIAAPWVYTLLTLFCGACLALLITWREQPSPRRTRRVRRVLAVYSAVVVALWVLFALADADRERLRDLDTYYANTPFMREVIVLYLLAHAVSTVVAVGLIRTWVGRVERWLRAGLISMQIGYMIGLLYSFAKFSAVFARWNGTDWDWLSTDVAMPIAALEAIFVAIGFILPHAGPFLLQRREARLAHRRLRPLWLTVRAIGPSPASVRIGVFAPPALRLIRRDAAIRDALLRLAPRLDDRLRARAHTAALRAGHSDREARGIAGAVDILAAVESFASATRGERGHPVLLGEDLHDLEPISRALGDPRTVHSIRRRAAGTESVTADA